VYACTHLANSASLLLPVSNLTSLLAFAASGLAFGRFAALMALPWLAVIGTEYAVFGRFFASDLGAATGPGSALRAWAGPLGLSWIMPPVRCCSSGRTRPRTSAPCRRHITLTRS
jgi:arsenical pump membrane protein